MWDWAKRIGEQGKGRDEKGTEELRHLPLAGVGSGIWTACQSV